MKKSDFTLIELLITIGIITILAAMLLPALNKARAKAHEINCIGNLKQLSAATAMYVGDFRDQLMPIGVTATGSAQDNRSLCVGGKNFGYGLLVSSGYLAGSGIGQEIKDNLRPKILRCPASPSRGFTAVTNFVDYCYDRDSTTNANPAGLAGFGKNYGKLGRVVIGYCICVGPYFDRPNETVHNAGVTIYKSDGSSKRINNRFYWDLYGRYFQIIARIDEKG